MGDNMTHTAATSNWRFESCQSQSDGESNAFILQTYTRLKQWPLISVKIKPNNKLWEWLTFAKFPGLSLLSVEKRLLFDSTWWRAVRRECVPRCLLLAPLLQSLIQTGLSHQPKAFYRDPVVTRRGIGEGGREAEARRRGGRGSFKDSPTHVREYPTSLNGAQLFIKGAGKL